MKNPPERRCLTSLRRIPLFKNGNYPFLTNSITAKAQRIYKNHISARVRVNRLFKESRNSKQKRVSHSNSNPNYGRVDKTSDFVFRDPELLSRKKNLNYMLRRNERKYMIKRAGENCQI